MQITFDVTEYLTRFVIHLLRYYVMNVLRFNVISYYTFRVNENVLNKISFD